MEPNGRRVGMILLALGALALAFMIGNASGRAQALWMQGGFGPRAGFEQHATPPMAAERGDAAVPGARSGPPWAREHGARGWGGHGWGGKPHFGFPWPLLVVGLGAALLWRAKHHGGPQQNEHRAARDEPRDPPSTGATTSL